MRTQPASPFFANRLQVVELARRRYFEEGVSPSGVISDAVFQSWARCQRLHAGPGGRVEFQPVTASRTQLALQRNRSLHAAWQAELPQLQMLLGTTSCAAMLTDASGVLIGATCAGRPHEQLMPVATRVGVDLSEEAVGTTAPGLAARTGQPVCVLGSEHFFDGIGHMHCAAVPIHDTQGCVAGVLDLSSEAIAFGFDAASVVAHFASSIENRLLLAQAGEQLVLRVQVAPDLLDAATVGLVGVSLDGRLAWLNGMASRLLGLPPLDYRQPLPQAETVLGQTLDRLASLPSQGAGVLALGNGLTLWARAQMAGHGARAEVWSAPGFAPQAERPAAHAAGSVDPATAAVVPSTVRDTHGELLGRTLRACGGNVSEAARQLGVSRGWIYRRLQDGDAG